MKRTLNDEELNQKKQKSALKSQLKTKSKSKEVIPKISPKWTIEEDEWLIKEVKGLENKNWRIVSKNLKKQFKNKQCTPLQCKQRWNLLESTNTWTPNEELILMTACFRTNADWSIIEKLFNEYKKPKEHFFKSLLEVAKRAKNEKEFDKGTEVFSEVLKEFIYLKFLLDALSENKPEFSQFRELIAETHVNKENCYWALTDLGRIINMEANWSIEVLNGFLVNAIEKLQNGMENVDQTPIGFDDIMHSRKIEENPENELNYCYVQIGNGPPVLYIMNRGAQGPFANFAYHNNN